MKTVTIRDIVFGEGIPKICVPIVGKNLSELLNEIEIIQTLPYDVVEWRVDYFEEVEDFGKVREAAVALRKALPENPLLLTFRTKKEGGVYEMSADKYFALYESIIVAGVVDLIDLELFMDEAEVLKMIQLAHNHDVKVVLCNHDFNVTPPKEEIVKRLRKMQSLGGDLCKIAVMPNSPKDVLTLLSATEEMQRNYQECPIITMSMGELGMISRVSGELFGSAMTFGAAAKASAPGQIPLEELAASLQLFHH